LKSKANQTMGIVGNTPNRPTSHPARGSVETPQEHPSASSRTGAEAEYQVEDNRQGGKNNRQNKSIKQSIPGKAVIGTLTTDSEGLGAVGGMIGGVDEVNGTGALEASGFVPTRHELAVIAEYWLRELLDIEFFSFCFGQTGSRELRLCPFAARRLGRIESILGETVVEGIERKVYSEQRAKVDPRLWKMFLNGERPQRDDNGLTIFPPERQRDVPGHEVE
jgi:hypothetical protein